MSRRTVGSGRVASAYAQSRPLRADGRVRTASARRTWLASWSWRLLVLFVLPVCATARPATAADVWGCQLRVYVDANLDYRYQTAAGDYGIPGVRVDVTPREGGPVIMTVTTDATGYAFVPTERWSVCLTVWDSDPALQDYGFLSVLWGWGTVPGGHVGYAYPMLSSYLNPEAPSPGDWTTHFRYRALQPHAVDAGAERWVSFDDTVDLTGSLTEAHGGTIASARWTQVAGDPVAIQGSDSLRATFVAPDRVQSLQFRLDIVDSLGHSVSDDVFVNVLEDAENAVFLAPNPPRAGEGTRGEPAATIEDALEIALVKAEFRDLVTLEDIPTMLADPYLRQGLRQPPADIYCREGVYAPVKTVRIYDGMSLYGGFTSGWRRGANPSAMTVLRGPSSSTPDRICCKAQGVDSTPTRIDGLTIESLDAPERVTAGVGGSSVALQVSDCNHMLTVADCRLVAGRGADGKGPSNLTAAAGEPGSAGARGADGTPFSPPLLEVLDLLVDTSDWTSPAGGAGGSGSAARRGGAGGDGEWSEDGHRGASVASGDSTAHGGAGGDRADVGISPSSWAGETGIDGDAGFDGEASTERAQGGSLQLWISEGRLCASPGTAGVEGQPGSGGGGGGGGGGRHLAWWKRTLANLVLSFILPPGVSFIFDASDVRGAGAGGGGGGAGGRGGKKGMGGAAGGSSIGLLLRDSDGVVVLANTIQTIGGGAGAGGQAGGEGGDGGDGGPGGAGDWALPFVSSEYLTVGDGGTGGPGGHGSGGGGGGGGCGGWSCGIAVFGGEAGPVLQGNVFRENFQLLVGPPGSGGSGGAGGAGNGNSGTRGAAGGDGAAGGRYEVYPDDPVTWLDLLEIRAQQTTVVRYVVEPDLDSVSFGTGWPGSDVVLTPVSPSGRRLPREVSAEDVIRFHGPTYERVTILEPEGGEWRLELYGADVAPDGEPVTVTVREVARNRAPIADPGIAQVIELESDAKATVVVDGSRSMDPDGDPLSFRWTIGAGELIAETPVAEVALPIGVHVLRLGVSDGHGGVDERETTITIRDVAPPAVTALSASRTTLWPPNHQLVQVDLSGTAVDQIDGSPHLRISGVEVLDFGVDDEDPVGAGHQDPDHVVTGALTVLLRAERSGFSRGRHYVIRVVAVDASGNVSPERCVRVEVPQSMK